MTALRRLFAPGLWRALGAVLVALGLILPIASCESHGGKNYTYALTVSAQGIKECQHQRAPPAAWLCYVDLERSDAVTLAAMLWPLAALVLAVRERRAAPTAARIVAEPLLMVGTLVWLLVLVARSEWDAFEAGSFAVVAGLFVGYFGWALELAGFIVRDPAAAAGAETS